MQEFTTQFKVTEKKEVEDAEGALEFTLTIIPEHLGMSGYLSLTAIDSDVSDFFATGDTFDVVITPHVVPE